MLFFGNESVKSKRLEHFSGLFVDSDVISSELRLLGDVLHLSLSFLFLQLEGNASDGAELDSSHKSGGVPGDLVADSFGRDHGNVVENSLVVMEVGRHSKLGK